MACYDLTVRIDVPERRVTVGGSFDVNFLGSDSIALVLWRHARIDTMRCDGHEAAYRFDTLAPAPTRFIPDGRALTLYRPAGSPDRCRIGTRYTLDMHEVQGPAKSFNDRWIEIGYYTGWYPVCNGTSADRSHLRIGIISRTDDGMWEMDQPWEGFDNVILASPVLKTRRMSDNGTTIEFIYTDFPDADAESALNCSYDALKFFRRLYKIAGEENTYIKFSLSASGTSGGYSRKNFITLNSGSFNEYILRNTAHEISHFLWNKARRNVPRKDAPHPSDLGDRPGRPRSAHRTLREGICPVGRPARPGGRGTLLRLPGGCDPGPHRRHPGFPRPRRNPIGPRKPQLDRTTIKTIKPGTDLEDTDP